MNDYDSLRIESTDEAQDQQTESLQCTMGTIALCLICPQFYIINLLIIPSYRNEKMNVSHLYLSLEQDLIRVKAGQKLIYVYELLKPEEFWF